MEQTDAVELIQPKSPSGLILVCEHASSFIPNCYQHLGLSETDRLSHAAWDIGAYDVATQLVDLLQAPLVASKISRLVYDCNRPPEAPSAIPERSELIDIPANRSLTQAARQARIEQAYTPFTRQLCAVVEQQKKQRLSNATARPILITIHSFTPIYFGKQREHELGFIYHDDAAFAKKINASTKKITNYKSDLNVPYSQSDGVTHTLEHHAHKQGLQSVMIEIRNDLIHTPERAQNMAKTLANIILDAINTD